MTIIKHEVSALIVGQRDTDGYVNATALCQAAGKLWANYFKSPDTKDFLAELSASIPSGIDALVQSKSGPMANGGGTWVHPQVATHLAQWASPKFAVLVSQWVTEWIAKAPPKPAITSQSAQALTDWMTVADLFKVPTHYAQVEGVKMVQNLYGVDYSPLLLQSPAMDNVQEHEKLLEPTPLGKHLGWGSGIATNKNLVSLGLQTDIGGQWVATELGSTMSHLHHWVKGNKSGYNLKWSPTKVMAELQKHKN